MGLANAGSEQRQGEGTGRAGTRAANKSQLLLNIYTRARGGGVEAKGSKAGTAQRGGGGEAGARGGKRQRTAGGTGGGM